MARLSTLLFLGGFLFFAWLGYYLAPVSNAGTVAHTHLQQRSATQQHDCSHCLLHTLLFTCHDQNELTAKRNTSNVSSTPLPERLQRFFTADEVDKALAEAKIMQNVTPIWTTSHLVPSLLLLHLAIG